MYDFSVQHAFLAHKFTGKERDSESGLDNFGARYMSSQYGRFMSADPFTVTPGRVVDPQQLNLYAYVRNNPLKAHRPDRNDYRRCWLPGGQALREGLAGGSECCQSAG
jgi:RHS repeat-associated protein